MRTTGIVVTLLSAAAAAAAQTPARITLTPVAELGVSDSLARSHSFHAIQLRSGRFLLAPQLTRAQLALYDSSGALLQTYTRPGRGAVDPALLLAPLPLPGDSILAFDRARMLTLDPALRSPRETRLDLTPRTAIITSNGQIVVNFPLVRGGGQTFALHLLDRTGAILRSIDSVAAGPTALWASTRALASAARGGFWVARANSSRIDHYDATGRLTTTVHVDRPWFTPWSGVLAGEGFRQRPRPRIASIHELPNGRLAIVNHVPDANWQSRERDLPLSSALDPSPIYDSIIEVIDPATSRVTAIGRVPDVVTFVPGSTDLLASTREPAPGEIRVVLWRLRLE